MKLARPWILLSFTIIFGPFSVQGQKTPVTVEPDPKAVKIWEKAIAAKGGRERLEGVRNLYQQRVWSDCKSGCVEDDLFVFPGKMWKLDMVPYGAREPRGDITTWNFETKLRQTVYRNMDASLVEGRKVLLDVKPGTWDADYSKIEYPQCILLLETKWIKPIPLSVKKGWTGFSRVDIVRVRFPGVIDLETKKDLIMDFYLDNNSYLPRETRSVQDGKADKEGSVTYSNYVEVNGIKLPQKLTPWRPLFSDPDTKFSMEYRYQINVNVDQTIFDRPLNNHMGRYEWREGN